MSEPQKDCARQPNKKPWHISLVTARIVESTQEAKQTRDGCTVVHHGANAQHPSAAPHWQDNSQQSNPLTPRYNWQFNPQHNWQQRKTRNDCQYCGTDRLPCKDQERMLNTMSQTLLPMRSKSSRPFAVRMRSIWTQCVHVKTRH